MWTKRCGKFFLLIVPFLVFGIFYLVYPPIKHLLAAWGSSITVCTVSETQPACYPTSWATPTLNWTVSFPNQEDCDCDGTPVNDCPVPPGCNTTYAGYSLEIYRSGRCGIVADRVYSTTRAAGGLNDSLTVPANFLNVNTAYEWRVGVRDSLPTNSGWTACDPFTTNNICAPAAPSGLNISQAYSCSTHRAGFSWTDNSSNETGFRLQRSPAGAGTWVTICTTAANDTTCAPADLTSTLLDGYNWDFRVEAYNAGGSNYSGTLNTNWTICSPSALTISAYDCAVHRAGFSWTDNSINETGFRVQRSPDGTGIWTTICTTAANDTTCAATAADQPNPTLDGASWDFRVEVYNGISASQSGIIDRAWGLCIPTLNEVRSDNCTHIYARWTDNSLNEDAYYVDARDVDGVGGNGSKWLCQVGAGVTECTNNTMLDDTDWDVDAIARDNPAGVFDSPNSNTMSVTTIICAPSAAEMPIDVEVSQVDCRRLRVEWRDQSTRETYFIVQNDVGGVWHDVCNIAGDSGNTGMIFSCPAVNIVPEEGTVINFRVQACNVTGCSPWAPSDAGTTGITDLCTPSGFGYVANSCNRTTYTWTDNTNNEAAVNGFQVQKRNTDIAGVWMPSCFAPASAGVGGVVSCFDGAIQDGTHWEFQVRAENAATSSLWTAPITGFTVLCPPTNVASTSLGCIADIGSWLFDVSWTDNSVVNDGYEMWRDTGGGMQYLPPLIRPGNTTSVFKLVDVDRAWDYRLRAFKTGIASSTWTPDFTLTSGSFCAPYDFQIDSTNCDCITVSWEVFGDESEIDRYEVYRDTIGNPYGPDNFNEPIGSSVPPNKIFRDCDIISDVEAYIYRVEADPGNLSSGDIVANNPCPTLPLWIETRY